MKYIYPRVAVIGGTSQIATAIVNGLHNVQSVYLVGRSQIRLENNINNINLDPAQIEILSGDIISSEGINQLTERLPDDLDLIIIAQGMLGGEVDQISGEQIRQLLEVNVLSPCLWIDQILRRYRSKDIRICVISSVAGDRGRASNYPYGMTKAALSSYVEGLSARSFMDQKPYRFTLLKPGLVDTVMIAQRKDRRAVADCAKVGQKAASALEKGREIVYLPGWWFGVMWIIRNLPRFIFRRLSL